MNVSEIIRKIADIVDQAESALDGETATDEMPCNSQLQQVDVDTTDNTDSGAMISPLQQEHELIKKATGVENNVEQFAAEDNVDELADMKKMAGIGEAEQGPTDMADHCSPVSVNPRANAAKEFHKSRTK